MSEKRVLKITALPGVPLIKPGDSLFEVVCASLEDADECLQSGDVLVIAQKIVSKSEGRLQRLSDVQVSERARELAALVNKDPRLVELILRESNEVVRWRKDVLIVEHRLGFVMANAGIDMSNVEQEGDNDTALLLPLNPDLSCDRLRESVRSKLGIDIGVVINDSHGRAWRNGTVGVAIGSAGVPALMDMRGEPDLFGRKLLTTEVGLADEIASAGSLLMGQAGEGSPIILMRGLKQFQTMGNRNAQELIRNKAFDMFR